MGLLHGRVGDCPSEQHQEAFFVNICVILRNPLQTKPYWLWKKNSSKLDSISTHPIVYVPYLLNEAPFLRPWKVPKKPKCLLISFQYEKNFFVGFVTFFFALLSLNTISRTIVSIQQNIFYIFLSDINSHKCDFDILEWLYCFANDFPLLIIKDWASINSSFKNAVFKSGNFGMNEHRLFTPILRNAGY